MKRAVSFPSEDSGVPAASLSLVCLSLISHADLLEQFFS